MEGKEGVVKILNTTAYTVDARLALSLIHTKKVLRNGKYMNIIFLFFILLILIQMIVYKDRIAIFSADSFPVLIILALYLIFKSGLFSKLFLKSHYKKFENTSISNLRKYEFTNDYISVNKEYSYTKIQWPGILKIKEDNNYFFLYISEMEALIVAKSGFRNTDEKNDFQKLIYSKNIYEIV